MSKVLVLDATYAVVLLIVLSLLSESKLKERAELT